MVRKNIQQKKSKIDIIKDIMVYLSAIAFLFGGGFKAGCFYTEIKCSEKNIQEIGKLQQEREQLRSELDLCKSRDNTISREEFEQLKSNINQYIKGNEGRN